MCIPSAIDQHYTCSHLSTPDRTQGLFIPYAALVQGDGVALHGKLNPSTL